jgi:hypothetical protein
VSLSVRTRFEGGGAIAVIQDSIVLDVGKISGFFVYKDVSHKKNVSTLANKYLCQMKQFGLSRVM